MDAPADVGRLAEAIRRQIGRVIVGKDGVVELLLVALLSGGHVLLEDVPGTGKTMLAKTLARCIGGTFRRIQCTPDLLPSDVLGVSVSNEQAQAFQFHPGPVMPTGQTRLRGTALEEVLTEILAGVPVPAETPLPPEGGRR